MMNSVEHLKILMDTFGGGWKDQLSRYLRGSREFDPEEKRCLSGFLDAYREDFVGNRLFNLAEVEKLVESEFLNNQIENYVDGMLGFYYATEPMRAIEPKDPVKVKAAIDYIFEHVILRYYSDFEDAYEKFGFGSKQEFGDAARALDSLCTYVVAGNFHKTTIISIIYSNIRLSQDACRHIGNRIDDKFETLQRKLLIGKLYDLLS